MEVIIKIFSVENIVTASMVLTTTLIGSVLNDYSNTVNGKECEVKIVRIIISTFAATMFMMGISDFLLKYFPFKLYLFFCFVAGSMGFKLFEKFKQIDLLGMLWEFVDVVKLKIENKGDDK